MYGLERPTYLCLKGDAHTDYYTAFATEELRATPPTVLCSVSLSSTVYMKTGNPAALVFIPICAGRRAGMWIIIILVMLGKANLETETQYYGVLTYTQSVLISSL